MLQYAFLVIWTKHNGFSCLLCSSFYALFFLFTCCSYELRTTAVRIYTMCNKNGKNIWEKRQDCEDSEIYVVRLFSFDYDGITVITVTWSMQST